MADDCVMRLFRVGDRPLGRRGGGESELPKDLLSVSGDGREDNGAAAIGAPAR